jgi:hypothetical protein
MTGFGEELSATFRLQNLLLAYETQMYGKERFRNKSAKQTRDQTLPGPGSIHLNDTFCKLLRNSYFLN